MGAVRYQFAYDSNNTIVDINDVSKDSKHNNKYTCISCGEEMIAKLGDIKKHHFAHKNDCTCNGETYLHKLAKRLIKEKFDTSKNFKVTFLQNVVCKEECAFRAKNCTDTEYRIYDLREHYDCCEEECEVEVNGHRFVPDLLLKNRTKGNATIWIEICVTHKCSDEKINSGNRIIEVSIQREEDIRQICRQELWVYENIEEKRRFKYYNFNSIKKTRTEFCQKKFTRVSLRDNGLIDIAKNISINNIMPNGSKVDFLVDHASVQKIEAIAIFVKYGYNIKTCPICKHHLSGGFCCLHKRYGTPLRPHWDLGNSCLYYCADAKKQSDILRELPKAKIEIVK